MYFYHEYHPIIIFRNNLAANFFVSFTKHNVCSEFGTDCTCIWHEYSNSCFWVYLSLCFIATSLHYLTWQDTIMAEINMSWHQCIMKYDSTEGGICICYDNNIYPLGILALYKLNCICAHSARNYILPSVLITIPKIRLGNSSLINLDVCM